MANPICAEYLSKRAAQIYIWTTVTISIWRVEKLGSEWYNNLPKVMTLMSGGPCLKASSWPCFFPLCFNFPVCKMLRVINYVVHAAWRSAFIPWVILNLSSCASCGRKLFQLANEQTALLVLPEAPSWLKDGGWLACFQPQTVANM